MQTKAEITYATMDPWKLFFKIAVPGMVSMFAMSVYNIIEGVFIGQRLGESALAAVNIAMPLVLINFSLADMIGVGASVPISIALGAGDRKKANNVFSCSLILIALASVLMGGVMFFAAEPLLRMMGGDGVLLYTAVRYLRAYALCSPLTTVFFAMDNYLRISGYVKTSMTINICSNLLTLALLTWFLFGLNMDIVGSAIATCTAICVCAAVAMIPFLMKKTVLQFARPRFSFGMVREIAACGAPVFLNNIAGRVTSVLINVALMTVGVKMLGEGGDTTAVAVYAVLMYASDLCWPLLFGIADSLAPAIGYNWGAGNYGRVKRIVRCAYIGSALIGLVSTAVLFFFPHTIASWFANAEDMRLLEISPKAIRLFCFAYLFRWFGVVTQSFFSAIKKSAFATAMSLSIALVFPVLMLGMLWPLGLDGIWLNFVGVNALLTVLGAILLYRVLKEIRYLEIKMKEK